MKTIIMTFFKITGILFLSMFVLLAVLITPKPSRAVSQSSLGQATALSPFSFVSESAVFNPATGKVQFTIEFNQPPDFFTVSSFGQQTNSFQYFIVGNPTLQSPEKFDSIIRGEEIHITVDTLPIRNAVPPVPDPTGGGWGALRGAVPFSLDGDILTFSTPLPLISNHSTATSLTD
jgi:hypothetical protein